MHEVIVDIFATLADCNTFCIRRFKWTGAAGSTNEEWIATRYNALKCKQLAIRYQCMKGFSPQKVDRKLIFLARTLRLHLKTLTPKKNYIYLWQGHASHTLVLTSYPGSVPECHFCHFFFLRPGADKFWVKNVISCPASYIYYSTKHNDGVEDYFNQTDNG